MVLTAVASDDGDENDNTPTLPTSSTTTGGMGQYVTTFNSSPSYTFPAPLPTVPDQAQIEADLRRALADRLVEVIRTYERVGYPHTFVQGMERALEVLRLGS